MAAKKFTLLELHLGDGTVQIGPATLGDAADGVPIGDGDAGADADQSATADGDGSGGRSCPGRTAGKLLLVLGGLVVVGLVVAKLLGGDEDLEELEDLADLETE
jgi:hypothetical protein